MLALSFCFTFICVSIENILRFLFTVTNTVEYFEKSSTRSTARRYAPQVLA